MSEYEAADRQNKANALALFMHERGIRSEDWPDLCSDYWAFASAELGQKIPGDKTKAVTLKALKRLETKEKS